MIEDFYLAAVPEPVTLLGLRLLPLSLGHLILLNRVKSAFVVGGPPSYEDLALSVFICSQTYQGALAAFEDPDLPRFMERWHAKLAGTSSWAVRLCFRESSLVDLPAKALAFADYLQVHTKGPSYSYAPGDCKEMECPPVQLVKVTLMKELHMTERDLLDRSWLLCLWDYVTVKALSGQVDMQDTDRVQQAVENSARLAQMVREGKIAI